MPGAEDGGSVATDSQIVSVCHVAGGWTVSNAFLGEALAFLSRQEAEQQAKTLAWHLTRLGFDSRVDLHDQDDVTVGTIWFWREFDPAPEAEVRGGA
jgi:hypothetical protein